MTASNTQPARGRPAIVTERDGSDAGSTAMASSARKFV